MTIHPPYELEGEMKELDDFCVCLQWESELARYERMKYHSLRPILQSFSVVKVNFFFLQNFLECQGKKCSWIDHQPANKAFLHFYFLSLPFVFPLG